MGAAVVGGLSLSVAAFGGAKWAYLGLPSLVLLIATAALLPQARPEPWSP